MANNDCGLSKWITAIVAIIIAVISLTGALYAKVQTSENRIQTLEGAIYEIRQDIKTILFRTGPK